LFKSLLFCGCGGTDRVQKLATKRISALFSRQSHQEIILFATLYLCFTLLVGFSVFLATLAAAAVLCGMWRAFTQKAWYMSRRQLLSRQHSTHNVNLPTFCLRLAASLRQNLVIST
jgi:hypothetical protein